MSEIINKKLHPYYKTGIYGWIGEEVDDNDYIICPICGDVLGMNYWDYSAENNGDNKCPKCKQELDYSEIYEFEDTCYYEQLVEMKDHQISDLEAKLAESEKAYRDLKELEQATKESLYASREYLEKLKSEKWGLEKALEFAVEELDDAKDMLRECNKNDFASLLNTSVDYFKVRGKEAENDRK